MKKILLLFLFNLSYWTYATTFYVSLSGAGTMDGSSWANAAPRNLLQQVIDNAQAGVKSGLVVALTSPVTATTELHHFQ